MKKKKSKVEVPVVKTTVEENEEPKGPVLPPKK